MSISTKNLIINLFPTYWKEKKGVSIIQRLSAEQGRLIDGSRKSYSCNKTHFGSSTLFDERLNSYSEISEKEYNEILNTHLSIKK